MRLTAPDEGFTHQISLPHAVVGSSDPNWRERYWVSVQDIRRNDFILSYGFGKYPNRDVMEGFAICALGSTQWNLRVSRQLSLDPDRIVSGPLSAEIVKPFETLRFRLDDNPSGLSFDLTWSGAMPSMLESRHFEVNRYRVTHDLSRYVQLGRLAGRVVTPAGTIDFEPATGWGERDHSWGIRPMASIAGDPPVASAEWNFLAFCPIQFESFCIHLYLFEAQYGRPTHLSASIVRPAGAPQDEVICGVDHDLEWDSSAAVRTLKGGRLILFFYGGRRIEIEISAKPARVYLAGGGYGIDQGLWKGDFKLEHEEWDLSDPESLKRYARSSSDHMIEANCDGERGYGIIEYIVRRGHEKYARQVPRP
jgi:hypothetical protein